MADRGSKREIFFIYDHNMLKKEEDDLKDAILFFTPENFPADDQCALCGQLMGMSEFLCASISKSQPHMFKFERDKFAVKRSGDYSLVLRGFIFMPDTLLLSQLESLHSTFVMYHGSIDNVRTRCKDNPGVFLPELAKIWRLILPVCCTENGFSVTQIFQSLFYTRLYEGGSQLFLQASHLLQSSQRRPYVLAGVIFYNNRVLCTQLPPGMTRQLTLLQDQMPHIVRKADLELPVGCKVVTVYLSEDDLSYIRSLNLQVRKHCKLTELSAQGKSEEYLGMTSHGNLKPLKMINTHVDFKKPLKLDGLMGNLSQKALQRVNGKNIKSSLSDVPIVECRIGESLAVSDLEVLNFHDNELSMGKRPSGDNMNESHKERRAIENEVISHDTEVVTCQNVDCGTTVSYDQSPSLYEYSKMIHLDSPTTFDTVESPTEVLNTENHDHTSSEKEEDKVNLLESLMLHENLELKSEVIHKSSDNLKQLEELHFDVAVMKGNTSTRNESKIVEQPIEPSISDYEDDSVEYHLKKANKTCVIEVNEDNQNNTECAEQVNIDIYSKYNSEFLRNSEDLQIQALSNDSSDDTVISRFYGSLTDDQTETVCKQNSHSVHQHKVCVHIESIHTNNNENNNMAYKTVQSIETDTSTSNTCEVTCAHSETDSHINTDILANDTDINIGNLANNADINIDNLANDSHINTDNLTNDTNINIDNLANDTDINIDNLANDTDINIDNLANNTHINIDNLANDSHINTDNLTNDLDINIDNVANDTHINIDNLANDSETNFLNPLNQNTDTQGSQASCMEDVVNIVLNANKEKVPSTELTDSDPVLKSVELDDTPEQGKCATEMGGQTDNTDSMGQLSCSSKLSAGKISRNLSNEIPGLNDVTVYVQCHSDISLVLIMDNPEHYEENLFHILWKDSLSHLADLDYYIKECMESCSETEVDHTSSFNCTRFDSCTTELTGTIESSSSSRGSNDIHQMIATLHTEFQQDQCYTDVLLRSHLHSCYGYTNQVEEVYFHSESNAKFSGQQQPHDQAPKYGSGLPLARDPVFSLDALARQILTKDKLA